MTVERLFSTAYYVLYFKTVQNNIMKKVESTTAIIHAK